jgi:hypothetical protein
MSGKNPNLVEPAPISPVKKQRSICTCHQNSLKANLKHTPYYKLSKRVLYIKEELYEIIRNGRHGGKS